MHLGVLFSLFGVRRRAGRVGPDDAVIQLHSLKVGEQPVRASEAGFEIGAKPIDAGVVGGGAIAPARRSRTAADPKRLRHPSLVEQFDARSAEISQLLRRDLNPTRSRELLDEMREAGLPT